MRIFRFLKRALVFLAEIILIAFIVVVVLVPQDVTNVFESIAKMPLWLRIVVFVIPTLFLMWVAFRQIFPKKKRIPDGQLVLDTGGTVSHISVDAVRSRVLEAVEQVPEVSSARIRVNAVQGNAKIEMKVGLSNNLINIPSKQKEIDKAIRNVVEKQLGLRVAAPPVITFNINDDDWGDSRDSRDRQEPVVLISTAEEEEQKALEEKTLPEPPKQTLLIEGAQSTSTPANNDKPKQDSLDDFLKS